jgi:hypothetical protein
MNMDIKINELLTFAEYAKLNNISLKTVYNYVNSGVLTPVIIGKSKFLKK